MTAENGGMRLPEAIAVLPVRRLSAADDVFAGGGEMGARMRAFDWAKTPLGPVAGWPQSLKTCVRIVLTSRQPMFVWWGESFINLYNDAYKSIVGGKHPAALGQPAPIVWRELWDQVGPRAMATMRGNEGTYDEALLLIMERNGYPEETYYTFSYSPVPDDEGRTGGLICANTDDTRRIVSERQLALLRDLAADTLRTRTRDEALARCGLALAGNSRDVPFSLIYFADAPGGPGAPMRTFGLATTSGIARGRRASPEVVSVDDDASVWPLAAVLESRATRVVELDVFRGDLPTGAWSRPPVKAALLPIEASGESGRRGVLIVGLSPHRLFDAAYQSFVELLALQIGGGLAAVQAYEEEKQRREALAEIDRAKTTFFSNVSHEFRTPLTLMLAPIEDLRTAPRDPEDRARVELLHRNALRLLKLVNTLLDFSRIEAGRVEAVYEPTELAAFTADIASTFRSTIERAGLRLVIDCPPLGAPAYVDRAMWEKIVLNLLSNAFKFTFAGSIEVRLREGDGEAALDVADTGSGIAEGELPRVFERFHRVEGARSRSHEGSGIGLSLVHELVRMHGGTIAVKSRFGEGTTFSVRVPAGAAHLPPDRVRALGGPPATAVASEPFVEEALRWDPEPSTDSARALLPEATRAGEAHRERIVVADDNVDMRGYVARLLGERWDVETVKDGQEALAAVRRSPPDLVLADVMMPGLDGFGLLRAMRADAALRDVPIVLLSARAGDEATAEGLQAGADDYLVKPFTARDLLVRVTARLVAARAARQADAQRTNLYRHFLHAPFMVAICRGERHVIEAANESALGAWGKGPEIIGRPLGDAVPEILAQGFVAILDRVVREGTAYEGRGELARFPTGPGGALEDAYFNYVYVPMTRPGVGVEGVLLCGFNVTEQMLSRRQAETLAAELRIASQRLEAAQRAAGIGIFDWDLGGKQVYWSDGLYALMGLQPGEIESTPDAWTDRLDEADREPGWLRFHEAVAAHKDHFEQENRLHQKKGGTRWVRLSTSILYDGAGVPCRVLGSVVDIQVLKEAAAARSRALEEAERANRAKDEFLATMSHELRTPLNAMLQWATMLKRDRRDEARLERGLAVIERNVHTQARLVNDLLDVSRIISGKLRLSLRETDVAVAIQAATDVVRPAADAKGVRLVLGLDPDLGTAVADPDRVQQIVWNLLSNAVRFTPPSGEIAVSAERTKGEVRIRVHDTGAGIPAEHLPHIFERFRQVDSSTTRAQGGLGLGLAIVRHLVEAHGGTVTAESEGVGLGATFIVDLPAASVPTSEGDPSRIGPGSEARGTTSSIPPMRRDRGILADVRALVLDDDEDSVELLRMALEAEGAAVACATSARQALAERGPFDVVVSDIGMPEMDGYTFVERLRTLPWGASVPAIALTAYARAEDAERALRAGYQRHMAKPIRTSDLLTAVRQLVRLG